MSLFLPYIGEDREMFNMRGGKGKIEIFIHPDILPTYSYIKFHGDKNLRSPEQTKRINNILEMGVGINVIVQNLIESELFLISFSLIFIKFIGLSLVSKIM